MSIYNTSASELRRKGAHYTVLPNHVLKSINSADALAIWAYLQSQSEGYIVRPSHIQQHLDIGEIRYAKAMTILRRMGLVSVQQQRNEQGHIIGNYIDCYSEPSTETPENPDLGKNQSPENPESGKTTPLIKDQGFNQESKEQSSTAQSAGADHATRARKSPISMKTWLTNCEQNGEEPITEDDPIFADSRKTGLPVEFILLTWCEFRDRYKTGDRCNERYADWRATFRNCVRGNWYKLWALDANGEFFLTTNGKMAMRRHEQEMAA